MGCCGFPPELLFLQSVSALLDKFKKSDQVFDINAERDSDVEDGVPAPADDDFTADSPRSVTTEKIGEFAGNKSLVALCESKRQVVTHVYCFALIASNELRQLSGGSSLSCVRVFRLAIVCFLIKFQVH